MRNETIAKNGMLHAPFLHKMMDTTYNMWRFGWDERNGGNISHYVELASS